LVHFLLMVEHSLGVFSLAQEVVVLLRHVFLALRVFTYVLDPQAVVLNFLNMLSFDVRQDRQSGRFFTFCPSLDLAGALLC